MRVPKKFQGVSRVPLKNPQTSRQELGWHLSRVVNINARVEHLKTLRGFFEEFEGIPEII